MSAVKHRKEKDCLNCGHIVELNFCPNCGQENIIVKEDALHMIYHTIADYFHFEHTFFGTLKPLLLNPGFLTKEYVTGRRISYINPIKLYIFVSIVFFIVILSRNNEQKDVDQITIGQSIKELTPNQKQVIDKLKKSLSLSPISETQKDKIVKDAVLNFKKIDEDTIKKDLELDKDDTKNPLTISKNLADYNRSQLLLPETDRDNFIQNFLKKRVIELNGYTKEKIMEDIWHKIPKMMFILLPLFALILKLVYVNKKKYYFEHLIYSFHLHSAFFLAILFAMLCNWAIGYVLDLSILISFLVWFYAVWYIYRSLRIFYESSGWDTILKMLILSLLYITASFFCILGLVGISLLTV